MSSWTGQALAWTRPLGSAASVRSRSRLEALSEEEDDADVDEDDGVSGHWHFGHSSKRRAGACSAIGARPTMTTEEEEEEEEEEGEVVALEAAVLCIDSALW